MTIKQLVPLSVFFFFFNGIVGGFFYTWLKFDVLEHPEGLGSIPGPWLVLPFLSFGVLALTLALSATFYFFSKEVRKGDQVKFSQVLLISFIGISIIFHLWFLFDTVLDPTSYA